MPKIRITDKYIVTKLKYKWTVSDFAKHYHVSEEEFTQILIREFGEKTGKGFLESMKANEETAQKKLKKKAANSNRKNNTSEGKQMLDKSAELNNKKNLLLKEIKNVCSIIVASNTEKEKNKEKIEEEFKEYKQIFEDVRKREQRIDGLIARENELDGIISENKNQEEEFRAQLKQIDDEIFKLSYIKVNCGIESHSETFDFNESDFGITADELRKKFHELIDDDEKTELFEDLSMKQMAKVELYILIVERVCEMGKKCKLYFPKEDNVTMALSLLVEDVVVIV